MQISSTQPSNSLNIYPEKKVHRTFILSGTLFQLILFPFITILFTSDESIGLLVIFFFPVYIIGGGLLGMSMMSIISAWHVSKKRFIKKGWWIQTFLVGYIVTTVFYLLFLSSIAGIPYLLGIGLTGGISTVLAGMSALPTLEEYAEILD